MNALIGHTGFIGGILKKNIVAEYFNRDNITEISKKKYNIVYCAGVPGTKWYANKFPEDDKKNINFLYNNLVNLECEKFVLISTISVYDNEPYGINRKVLENNLLDIFKNKILIIRLPAVFGEGLKKNILFDMLNGCLKSKINIKDKYQWYNVNNIKDDIDNFINSNQKIIELYPEPITNEELVSLFSIQFQVFNDSSTSYIQNKVPQNGYIQSAETVKKHLKKFIDGYC